MNTTPAQLISMIRYQLGELRVQNAHHDFEHLARHLARARLYSNILPATGPVSAGGDQGRDFETFDTGIEWPVTAGTNFWRSTSKGRRIAFACSLEMKIEAKIRDDLLSIIAGGPVDEIVYFCESNLAISKRHKLQDWAGKQSVALQLFDGNAIAEMLSARDTYWIAQEYLRIPAELMPREGDDANWYAEFRIRWQDRKPLPISQSDFFEIKSALRHSTFHIEARPELLMWIARMEGFLADPTPRQLQRNAIYEIAVASLRGKGEMDSQKARLVDYYSDVDEFIGVAELQDAATLLLYSFGALKLGGLSIDLKVLFSWGEKIVRVVDDQIKTATGPGRRSELLGVRGYVGLIPAKLPGPPDSTESFQYWRQMLDEAAKAPLFPVESFSDFLTKIIEYVDNDSEFLALAARVDDLIASRAGAAVVGEKALERAVALLEKEHNLSAIRELHRVKIKWFSGERLEGAVRSLILLADSYRCLGLAYAAKYYALAAAYIATYDQRDSVTKLLPTALFEAVEAEDSAGNSVGMMQLLLVAIAAHCRLDQDPLDTTKHPRLQENLGQVAALIGFLRRGQPELEASLGAALDLWPEPIRNSVLHTSAEPDGFWLQGDWTEAWARLEEALIDRPFNDLGPAREVRWRALGIHWSARFTNTYAITPAAEQFLAELQLAICALAQEDLAFVPTRVIIEFILNADRKSLEIEQVAGPDEGLVFALHLPEADRGQDDWRETLQAISIVLRTCSLLPEKEFFTAFERCMTHLPEQIFIARPYAEIYREFVPPELFLEDLRCNAARFRPDMAFSLKEPPELAWPERLGPTYSAQIAHESVTLRYQRLLKCVGLTAKRLTSDPEAHAKLKSMHDRGFKDWEILAIIGNIAMNLRLGIGDMDKIGDDLMARGLAAFDVEETPDTALAPEQFTVELFDAHETVFIGAHVDSWGLRSYAGLFDRAAFERFMTVRYRMRDDDIPHDDIFGWNLSPSAAPK